MRSSSLAPTAAQFPPAVALTVRFFVGRLTPRAVRRRFVTALRLEIARARLAGEIDIPIAEELWRALPSADHA